MFIRRFSSSGLILLCIILSALLFISLNMKQGITEKCHPQTRNLNEVLNRESKSLRKETVSQDQEEIHTAYKSYKDPNLNDHVKQHPSPVVENVLQFAKKNPAPFKILSEKDMYKFVKQKPAGSGTHEEEFKRFEEYFATQQAVCKNLRRIGGVMPRIEREDPDGAWWLCFDEEVGLNTENCIVYSVGINNDWSFDEHMARYNCQVYSFDPSLGLDDHNHKPRINFYNLGWSGVDSEGKKGVEGKDGWKMRTFASILKLLNHTEKIIDVLKMDIELSEWDCFEQMLKTDILQKHVKQLAVEIHLGSANAKRFGIIKWLERQGFLVVNLHRNLMCNFCFEVSYVNINLVKLKTNTPTHLK